jgi:hypothetical protein
MLSETQVLQVGNFDSSTVAALRAALGGGVDAVSAAGACSLEKYVTELTVSGTKAYTLAAPTVAGQKKRIVCVAATSTPLGSLTITSPDDTTGFVCATVLTFNAVGQAIELIATSALKWRCVRVQRAGALTVVVGTDVLTGLNLNAVYLLSVTGTVSSTTTKGLPNGSAVGEQCMLINSVAALSPIGDISGTFINALGAAATSIGAIGSAASATVIGDSALLQWNGSAWQTLTFAGVTFA